MLTENTAVAVISMIGTCVGSFGGIITASN